ncbi:hypothetical protein KCU83_g1918, partial [Aureobasidium melanogenum]
MLLSAVRSSKAEPALQLQKNTLSALEARARPNQRLKLAFDIDSCFTSSDERSCKNFRASVERLLYVAEKDWVNFATTAREIAKEALDGGNGDTASLFGVVQLLTLKTMMRIATLAHEVNLQWLRSKECTNNDNPPWLFDQQTSLKDAVKAVFPNWNEFSAASSKSKLAIMTMLAVGATSCTTRRQLEAQAPQPGPKVAAIHVAKEALRLYPPTRRIYREHRDFNVWKYQPNIFSPTIWIGKEEGYDEGYMPFGASPFNCPAKRWRNVPMPLGLSMIALLVGTLIEATDAKWEIHGDFPDKNWPLDTDREAYGAAVLRKL